MNLSDPITVGLILLCAGAGAVAWIGFCVFMHHRERSGPPHLSDWGVSAWGDVPKVPNGLFHNETHTPEAKRHHV